MCNKCLGVANRAEKSGKGRIEKKKNQRLSSTDDVCTSAGDGSASIHRVSP